MASEAERLEALRHYNLLDTLPEPQFDQIVELARAVCDAPIALVSLVDAHRQWFKAKSGVEAEETHLSTSVCALAIQQHDIFEIDDLSTDFRTSGMSLVTGEPHIRFYAGAPLITSSGHALGSLCIIDTISRPGGLTDDQRRALRLLGDQTITLIEMRDALSSREDALASSEAARRAQALGDRYHAIVDSAIDSAIISVDDAGRVTSWSKGSERLFGWIEAEMLGQPADRIFTPEDCAAGVPASEFETARSAGRASDERWHLRKDGTRFYAHGAMTPLRGTAETGFVKAVRNITAEHENRNALELSREQAAIATRSARLGTFDYRLRENVLDWDDRCRAVFGLSPGAPVSYAEAFLRGVHPEDREAADAAVRRALDPSGSGTFDTEYRTIGIEDGLLRHVSARGQAYFEDGEPVRLVGTVQDITEQRDADQKLRETEDRLRLAVLATNDAIWDWDLVADTVQWNEALEAAYGHAPEDVEPTGAWWIAQIHPDDRERVSHAIHAIIDGDQTDWRGDYRFRRGDGSYADVSDRGYVIRDGDGAAVRMVGAMLDQTTRMALQRRLEASLEESAAELDRMWRYSPDLQVALNPDGVIVEANAAWTALLGYEREELEGRLVMDLVHHDDLDLTLEALEAATVGTLPVVENRYRHKDGSYRWVSWVAAPSGRLIFATGRDVTAQKQQQDALNQAEDALRQAQKVEAIGQLTGGVAHDFNNLLTVIRGSVDMLRRPNLSEERRERYVDAIADTADRATRLTSQLLAFARRSALQPQSFDSAASLAAIEPMLRTLTGSRTDIHLDIACSDCWINADPTQFDTAIVNIAVNARDAMSGEGDLKIILEAVDELPAVRSHPAVKGAYVALTITDTGTGIAPDKLARIFEPFFTTKEVGHGTGLGLSQVFGFAKQSGGDVIVQSVEGRGTTFTLYLPRVAADDKNRTEQPAQRPLKEGACVLVVEDNAEVGDFATEALTELGYGSHWSQNAEAALSELEQNADRYDVVFTDVVMPGMSGVDFAEEVRRRFPNLPVVLTSGYSHILAQRGSSGFELLQKPYSMDELARTLRSVVAED